MRSVIVLEDNKQINDILRRMLEKVGYIVYSTYNAFDALKVFKSNSIDCVITDLMLPIMSGEDFIKEIRKISDVHIIVISAKTENSSKIESLKLGADDYLCKPFLQEEVELKINNLFNKKDSINKNKTFNNNEVLFIEGKTTITVNNEEVLLTAIEYRILKLLIDEAGRVITREQFLDNLYSYGDEVYDRVIDVHITNIRRKIKKHYKKELIKTIYGLGYCFVGDKDE